MNFIKKIIKKVWDFFKNPQVWRFGVSGMVMTISDAVPYAILLRIFGDGHYMASHNATTIFSNIVNFCMQRYWVFNNRRPGTLLKQILLYMMFTVIFALISNAILWFLVSGMHFTPMWGKLIKIAIMGVLSWPISSSWIFQGQKP